MERVVCKVLKRPTCAAARVESRNTALVESNLCDRATAFYSLYQQNGCPLGPRHMGIACWDVLKTINSCHAAGMSIPFPAAAAIYSHVSFPFSTPDALPAPLSKITIGSMKIGWTFRSREYRLPTSQQRRDLPLLPFCCLSPTTVPAVLDLSACRHLWGEVLVQQDPVFSSLVASFSPG